MDANWATCLRAILVEEGGNDDDPDDSGGRTSRGIIQREYDAYRKSKGLPTKDVWTASDGEVADIYRMSYWLPFCPEMPGGVDLVYFDMAVNAGPYRSAVLLQRSLGVAADGHIGVVTRHAISTCRPLAIIADFSNRRRAFYRRLKGFWKFGKGWLARVSTIERKAKALVTA